MTVGASHRSSVLLLTDDLRGQANTLLDHVAAFGRYSHHRIYRFSTRGVPDISALDLEAFDVIVLHYSVATTFDTYLSPSLRERISAFEGLKIQFLQDEYRWVDAVTAMTRRLGIDVLFTVASPDSAALLYADRIPDVRLEYTIPGFVPEKLERRRSPAPAERTTEVGYRGRTIPYHLGKLSQEKVEIARGFLERARVYGLGCDIAWNENDRIYGERWNRFIGSCRVTLGTESGASIADFDGSIEQRVRSYLESHPGATFSQVHEDVLAAFEGNVVVNTISPRLFEAAAMRSGLVLFPGEYSGAVRPWETYIPLEKDFSNMDEVADAIRDLPLLEAMIARAHEDLIASGAYSYRTFIRHFDSVVDELAGMNARGSRRTHLRASVERARTTHTVAGRRIRRPTDPTATSSAISLALERHPPIRRLARRYLVQRDLRRHVALDRLRDDILRLAILFEAQLGTHTVEQFWVVPRLDADRTLALESRVGDRTPGDDHTTPALEALRSGDIESVLWDHSGVALTASILRRNGTAVTIPVGYHGRDGVYVFGSLSDEARRAPEKAVETIAPILLPPRPYRPSACPPTARLRLRSRARAALPRKGR